MADTPDISGAPGTPWLTIVGLGEDAPKGLPVASQSALEAAEIIMGASRHLSLLPPLNGERIAWPVPFSDGIDTLLRFRGRPVAVLASANPFWFGAGTTIAKHLERHEWTALPGPSTFSLAASQMGWPMERTGCFGLHAAPMSRLRPCLAPGARMIVLLRNGKAVSTLAAYLTRTGFGESRLCVLERLGGPYARRTDCVARSLPDTAFQHPVCVAIDVAGSGDVLPLASGRPDTWFDNDGAMTKRPVRALTLSALAPHPFEHLWDIGGGSGSVGIEWLLCHPSLSATTIESCEERAARIVSNATTLGMEHLNVVIGTAPQALQDLQAPDVVFVGGGLSEALLDWLTGNLRPGTRIVANAVTLESETLITGAQARLGGELLRCELAQNAFLGDKRAWKAHYPIVQWSVVL